MRRMQGFSYGKHTAQKASAFYSKALSAAPHIGGHLYTAMIVAVTIGCLWLAATLSRATTLAELRPVLQTALAPVAALFGVIPEAAPIPVDTIKAAGQIVALDAFDVAARVSARNVFMAKEGATIAEGEILARFDDSTVRATLASAERRLADARTALTNAGAAQPVDGAGIAFAYEQGATVLSNIHLNLAWIFAASDSVLNQNDLRDSQSNSYVYADLIRVQVPEIMDLRFRAADADEKVRNSYAKTLAVYRTLPRDASPQEIESALADAYAILEANADALKATAVFLVAVREGHEEADLTMPETLRDHEASIIDAQRTTNDNLEAVAYAREAIRLAKGGNSEAPDMAALERAVTEAEQDIAAARADLERYVVVSPVSGIIVDVRVPQGSAVVDGQILATVTTDAIAARVAFSETDVTRAKVGDTVTLSLDGAGFTATGNIISIDPAATVENGVVSFFAHIGFTDERIRPGMSVTAHIRR